MFKKQKEQQFLKHQQLLKDKEFISKMEQYIILKHNWLFHRNEVEKDIYDLYYEDLKVLPPKLYREKVLGSAQKALDNALQEIADELGELKVNIIEKYQLTFKDLFLLKENKVFWNTIDKAYE